MYWALWLCPRPCAKHLWASSTFKLPTIMWARYKFLSSFHRRRNWGSERKLAPSHGAGWVLCDHEALSRSVITRHCDREPHSCSRPLANMGLNHVKLPLVWSRRSQVSAISSGSNEYLLPRTRNSRSRLQTCRSGWFPFLHPLQIFLLCSRWGKCSRF